MNVINRNIFVAAMLGMASFSACTPENSNKKLDAIPAASFTVAPVATNANRFVVNNTTPGAFMYVWTTPVGGASRLPSDTFTFGRKGDYDIKLVAYSQGGSSTTTNKVSVANNLPPTLILQGANLTDAGASAFWKVLKTPGTATTINFSGTGVNFSSGGTSNGAIYQRVKINSMRDYYVNVYAHGNGMVGDSAWLDVYLSNSEPLTNWDYTTNLYVSLNTRKGCGGAAFNGNMNTIACFGPGAGKNGFITFGSSGDYYLVIKAGSLGSNPASSNLGAGGITVDSVSLWEQIR
ncbi:hypothetical protein CLV59_101678 [Chitinophaga dinghuensis]|uniref:PKD domain-containing protein n=1 Tax=Chitinophaga dinghuensis TaxID=1539050 RepID=A0A327WBF8_9BACT|nr:PKD domain-containing protein [Chitinophaga dinghuensis]RAJ87913.1 hypothetical protein CLV59_101678 [Chitinophaga dinghuensis]